MLELGTKSDDAVRDKKKALSEKHVQWKKPVVTDEWILVKRYNGSSKTKKGKDAKSSHSF